MHGISPIVGLGFYFVTIGIDHRHAATTSFEGSRRIARKCGPTPQFPESSTNLNLKVRPSDFEALLVGTLFGFDSQQKDVPLVDPNQVLLFLDDLVLGNQSSVEKSFDSLTFYLERWALMLGSSNSVSDKLTTPIQSVRMRHANNTLYEEAVQSSGIKLKFCPPKRYLSYNEQKGMEKGKLPDRKGAKVDAWSPGGIEMLVFHLPGTTFDDHKLHFVVRRCDIDGDTVIKLTSERQIIRRLKEAIRIWRKVRDR